MVTTRSLRTLEFIPSLLIVALVVIALAIGLPELDAGQVAVFAALAAVVATLMVVARSNDQRALEILGFAIASVSLFLVAVFIRPVDIATLYGLIVMVMGVAMTSQLSELTRSISTLPLSEGMVEEVAGVLTSAYLRQFIVLIATFLLAILAWASLSLLSLGPTSEFTAFFLAGLVILILIFLALLPG